MISDWILLALFMFSSDKSTIQFVCIASLNVLSFNFLVVLLKLRSLSNNAGLSAFTDICLWCFQEPVESSNCTELICWARILRYLSHFIIWQAILQSKSSVLIG